MSLPSKPVVLWLPVLLLAVTCRLNAQDTDPGLFADVETTFGEFTIKLDYKDAPQTVANFAGLAEGSQPWIDYATGEVRQEPFYDGIAFHRVVDAFVIQAGSPAGDGTDGPGYTFRDEFRDSLRHNRPYIVSMANSGPHSNGSQFFVTLADTPFLNGKHSVFGQVVEGMEVLDDIGQVTVDTSARPIDQVVIEHVTIRREGDTVEDFDFGAQGLPRPQNAEPKMTMREGAVFMNFERAENSAFNVFRTDDLYSWMVERLPIAPAGNWLDVSEELIAVSQRFYRVTRVDYLEPVLTSPTIRGQTIVLDITSHEWKFILRINEEDKGEFDFNEGLNDAVAGRIVSADWVQEAYRGVVTLVYDPATLVVPMRCSLVFETRHNGSFKGTVFLSEQPFDIDGTFTLEPTENL